MPVFIESRYGKLRLFNDDAEPILCSDDGRDGARMTNVPARGVINKPSAIRSLMILVCMAAVLPAFAN